MEILAFSIVVILAFWWFRLRRRSHSERIYELQSQRIERSPSTNLGSQQKGTLVSARSCLETPERNTTIAVSDRALELIHQESLERFRDRLCRHQLNILRGRTVIGQLRSSATEIELPNTLAVLRQMNPYVFEELLLSCCKDQGWQILPNFRYSGDGGIDGRVLIAGSLYVIQAKRYSSYIQPKHIYEFHEAICVSKAVGGIFFHTGKTGATSKRFIEEYQIILISGQRLVDFVLGRRLKIVEVTKGQIDHA